MLNYTRTGADDLFMWADSAELTERYTYNIYAFCCDFIFIFWVKQAGGLENRNPLYCTKFSLRFCGGIKGS